jgi:hypothetical protein
MTVSMQTFANSSLREAVESHVRALGSGSCFVRGFGFVRGAIVRVGDQELTVSAATLVSLTGSAHVADDGVVFRATAVLSHSVGGVPVLIGGELLAAEADGVECVFDRATVESVNVSAPDDAPPAHAKPAAPSSPVPVASTPVRVGEPAPEKLAKPSIPKKAPVRRENKRASKAVATSADWARVLAASQEATASDADGEVDVDELERGDILLHPSLEECTILAVISDDAVKVRLPNGSVRKLVMRNFRLFSEGDGRYRVEKRAKG